MQSVEGCAAACTETEWPSMCQGFYTGPGVSRYQYCHDAARADNKAACDAASTCCDWVLPDPNVNTATMSAAQYCLLLNDKMGGNDDADICTATTCCRMVTEQDQNGVQQTTCQSKLPVADRTVVRNLLTDQTKKTQTQRIIVWFFVSFVLHALH